jgi:MinD-like ATPase involved in chromosome partitioning or flagellar assembly
MKITVYNAKGGAGKTPIATNIVLDHDYTIGTNEAYQVYDSFIDDERMLSLDLSESFPEIPNDIDIVFDLAGTISDSSHSITSAIIQSDLIIVPIYNEVKSLAGGIGNLNEIQNTKEFKGKCLVVATKLSKERKEVFKKGEREKSNDYQNVLGAVRSSGFTHSVLPLKYSKAFDAIFEKEMSIAQMCEADPLTRCSQREVQNQFDNIYKFIKSVADTK